MDIELINKLTCFTLGLSFLILCGTFWTLKKARSHLHGVQKMAQPWWYMESRSTLILPTGYHEGS